MVEDDNCIREIIAIVLELEFKVVCFSTIAAFENTISIEKPALILLDIRLSDGNGIDLCKKIKNNSDLSDIPVLLMSANNDAIEILEKSKAEDFIPKPFDIFRLQEQVARYAM